MKKRIEKTNTRLVNLIERFSRQKKGFWKKVAEELAKPRRKKVEVNLSKIDVYSNDGQTILVPGKVLGAGKINKKVTIAAFSYSKSAKKIIESSGGKAMSIEELFEKNPEGKDIFLLI